MDVAVKWRSYRFYRFLRRR